VLAFFAASDGIVNENLVLNFMREVQIPEARCFYGFQVAIENIHAEMYSLLIDTYIKEPKEKDFLFHALQNLPCVPKKANGPCAGSRTPPLLHTASSHSLPWRVFSSPARSAPFSGSKNAASCPGLTFSNELISRDEGLHCDFACLLYSMLSNKIDPLKSKRSSPKPSI
jgi:ribonucleoside-diphosphate reductase beta chain